MRNAWLELSALILIDDTNSEEYLPRLGESLSRTLNTNMRRPNNPPPTVSNSASLLTKPAAKPKTKTKVFQSSPTLRQLMSEYNRPLSRLAPIKPATVTTPGPRENFRFDRIDYISIPTIPGRVLRPSS